jgi:hypothetical protein
VDHTGEYRESSLHKKKTTTKNNKQQTTTKKPHKKHRPYGSLIKNGLG